MVRLTPGEWEFLNLAWEDGYEWICVEKDGSTVLYRTKDGAEPFRDEDNGYWDVKAGYDGSYFIETWGVLEGIASWEDEWPTYILDILNGSEIIREGK